MDEKGPAMAPRILSTPTFTRRSRLFSIRRLILAVALVLTVYWYHPSIFSNLSIPVLPSQPAKHEDLTSNTPTELAPAKQTSILETTTSRKVTLEAHIMSKCPDARDCLRQLVVPAMKHLLPIVDFKLYYIGTVAPDDNSVTCMHGPAECLGNSISLCAQELYSNNTKVSLGFTNCLLKDYKNVPDKSLVQDCALEHGVDFESINTCVSENGRGEELLRKSVLASKEKGVKYSCTVRVEDDIWCVRDSGKWKECGTHGGSVDALVGEVQRRAGAQAKKDVNP